MLFDLRGTGRRRTVKVIYVTLAILMGGGLILFGIGGGVSGGLVDAVTGDGSGGGDSLSDLRKKAEERVAKQPRSEAAWAALVRAQFNEATTNDKRDPNTGVANAKGLELLRKTSTAWDRYLALKPAKVDQELATLMVQVYSAAGLNQPAKAVTAQEAVTESSEDATAFAQLAILAYQAGQVRKGDLAAQRALELTPKADRSQLKKRLDEAKQAAASTGGASGQGTSG